MKDEQLEIWFEAIETQLKEIQKKLATAPAAGADQQQVQVALDEFINKLKNIKVSVPQQDLGPLAAKLDDLLNVTMRISQPIKAEIVRTEHYFFFFPDLKDWLARMKRAKFVWILAVLLTLSVIGNFYLGSNYGQLKDSDYKYRYLKSFGGNGVKDTINRLDRSWPNIETKFIKAIEEQEAITNTTVNKQQRIQDLQKELDSLKTK